MRACGDSFVGRVVRGNAVGGRRVLVRSGNRRSLQLAFVLIAVFILGICVMGFARVEANPVVHEKYYTSITIQEGDSLWSIAQDNYTNEYDSMQDYIDEVKHINHLYSDTITAGNHIVIPHYTSD